METVIIVLVLLAAVVISNAITQALPIPIPTPLIQICVGYFISAVADFGVILRPELFFFLFLPPLLFLDGWRIPKEGLKRDKWTILEMALGLVVFTVIGVGFFIHWLIPAIPLAVAFALAAIMSPTDPIAVSAITERITVPKRLMHILEGESLLNDASGLVSMRFAVAAAMTGTFSLLAAFLTFLWTALAGLAIGAATTFLITRTLNLWTKRFEEETGSQIVISLLIPFIAYLAAEQIEASGILAAVAAGISMSFTENSLRNMAATRIRRLAVWDTLQFVANGIIFVLLGEQLPQIIGDARIVFEPIDHQHLIWLFIYVIAIYFALVALRFLWVWLSLRFNLARANRKRTKPFVPGWRLIAATSLAGVRGTITLAGILTLPLLLPNGEPFPARDLAIFLAAGVIVLSLLIASISLPYLLCNLKLPPEPSQQKEEEKAQAAAAEAAIKAIEQEVHSLSEGRKDADLYATAGTRVMQIYRQRLTELSGSDEETALAQTMTKIERRLHLKALRAQRIVYYNCKKRHQLSEESADKFLGAIDLLETHFTNV